MGKKKKEKAESKQKTPKEQHRYDVIHMQLGEITREEKNVTRQRAKEAFSRAYDTGNEAVIIVMDGKRLKLKEMVEMTANVRKDDFFLSGSSPKCLVNRETEGDFENESID